jgi:hypothetical protein
MTANSIAPPETQCEQTRPFAPDEVAHLRRWRSGPLPGSQGDPFEDVARQAAYANLREAGHDAATEEQVQAEMARQRAEDHAAYVRAQARLLLVDLQQCAGPTPLASTRERVI